MIKKINKEILLLEAKIKIARNQEKKEVFTAVKEVFKTFEGKKITKRIASTLQNELLKIDNNLVCSYNKDKYGFYEFYIWNRREESGINYNNRIMLIIHDNILIDDKFNYENFINNNKWLNSSEKIIEDIKKEIELIENTDLIEKYNEAIETIENTKSLFKELKYNL